jgi:hypothetical protein
VKMDKEGDGYSLAHVAADQGYGNNKWLFVIILRFMYHIYELK